MLTNQGAPDGGGWSSLHILCWWYFLTLVVLTAGRLGVLTMWGGVTEPLAPIFMAVCCFLSEGEGSKSKNDDAFPFIT